jgi:hypothetical protein
MKLTAKLATLAAIVGLFAALAGFAGSAKAALIYPYPLPMKLAYTDLVVSSDGSTVTVSNLGPIAAGGFYVTVGKSTGDTCWYDGSQTKYISGLAGNSSYRFTLTTTSDAPRSLYVDPTNSVAESNEFNNSGIVPAVFTAC